MRPDSGFQIAPNWPNWKNSNEVTIFWHDVTIRFLDVNLFLLSSLVTAPSFMSIPSLVHELWQFLFIRD